jgi:hypothetical protein
VVLLVSPECSPVKGTGMGAVGERGRSMTGETPFVRWCSETRARGLSWAGLSRGREAGRGQEESVRVDVGWLGRARRGGRAAGLR